MREPTLLTGLAVLAVVAACAWPALRTGGRWRRIDPQRWFDPHQRATTRHLAGGRCEYPAMWAPWRRCPSAHQETDHFFPHARGGATSQRNAVAACKKHNQAKGSRMPSALTGLLITRRRRAYYPPGWRTRPGQWWNPHLDRHKA